MTRKNGTPEENARREKIRELLQMAMDWPETGLEHDSCSAGSILC